MDSWKSNASASSAIPRPGRLALVVIVCALVGGWSSLAQAKRIGVVLDFSGPRADKFRDAVVDIVGSQVDLIPVKRYQAASKKVRRYKPNDSGIAKVAERLALDVVVTGKVVRRRGKFRLSVEVRDGYTGKLVQDEILVTSRRPALTRAHRRILRREILARVREIPDPDKIAAELEEEEDERDGEDEEPVKEERVAEADDEKEDDEPAEDEPEAVAKDSVELTDAQKADLAARGRAVDVTAGLSFIARKLTFQHDPSLVDVPQGYDGAMVPGLYVAAELYPMALVNENSTGIARNIGVDAVVDKVLIIKSSPADMPDVSLPTSQTRFGFGVVYRHNFGDKPTSPTLKAGVRYNALSFVIEEEAEPGVTIDLPDVNYAYIDPGLGLRYPINEKIAASAEARYLIITGTGQMQEPEQYGSLSPNGISVDLAGEYKLSPALAVRAGFHFMQMGLTFGGDGALTDRNGDAMQDVSSATDRFLGFFAAAGYSF